MNILLLVQDNWSLSSKKRNKKMKSWNGNGTNSINLVHWNLGSRFWHNKKEDIQLLVDDLKPDFTLISEANLWETTEVHEAQIEGYDLIMSKSMSSLHHCRIIALVKTGLNYKIEDNLMSEDIASIWLKLGGKGRKSVFVGGVYREHTIIGPWAPQIISDNKD